MKTFCCKILRLDVKDYNIKARYTVNGIFRGSVVKKKKKSHLQCRRRGFNPSVGKPPGGAHGNPLQCSCLGNPMDRRPGGLQSMDLQRVGHD